MCAYNQVNGVYACENGWLLNDVLKGDWGYPGFVMSDWGAVHSTVRSALAGLDQELGDQLDTQNFFEGLGRAAAKGEVPQARLDDMARRILTSIYALGLAEDTAAIRSRGSRRKRRSRAGHRARRRRPPQERGPAAAVGGCARASSWSARMPIGACRRAGDRHR